MAKQTTENHKTALITGADSGFGYEMAELFAQSGHDLVLVAGNRRRVDGVAEEFTQRFGVNVTVLIKDLSTPRAAEEILNELRNRALHTDILVNYAGFDQYGPFYEINLAREQHAFQSRIEALTSLTRGLLPGMIKRNDGKILNIDSSASFDLVALLAANCASRAQIHGLSKSLAEELEGTGVTVTMLSTSA
jgi:uncharacterized protein